MPSSGASEEQGGSFDECAGSRAWKDPGKARNNSRIGDAFSPRRVAWDL